MGKTCAVHENITHVACSVLGLLHMYDKDTCAEKLKVTVPWPGWGGENFTLIDPPNVDVYGQYNFDRQYSRCVLG